jgi:hypothetical protein
LDLSHIVRDFPWIHIAQDSDNAELLDFIESHAFGGATLQLRYSRRPDFFEFLRYQSEDHAVVFSRHPVSSQINGLGSLGVRRGYWRGELQTVGYMGDLRVPLTRGKVRQWKQVFTQVIDSLKKSRDCRFYLTAIVGDNSAARRSLVERPHPGFRYSELSPYRMMNILFAKAWKPSKDLPKGYRIETWTEHSQDSRFLAFLDERQRALPFGWVFDSKSLDAWTERRPGFGRECFSFVSDADGRLLMGAALWSPNRAKRILVDRSPYGHWPLLSKWLALPRSGEEYSVSYLTHWVEAPSLHETPRLRSLLRRAFVEHFWSRKASRFLAAMDYPGLSRTQDLRSRFVVQDVPMTLYAVHREEETLPQDVCEAARFGTGFELSLV